MMKKSFIIHPFLFAVAPILYFFSVNKDELSFGDTYFLASLGMVLVIGISLWFAFRILLKSKEKGAVIASLFLTLFFSYGHVRELIPFFKFEFGGLSVGPDKTLLVVWGSILVANFLVLARTKRSLAVLTNFLNVVVVSLLLILLVDIVPHEFEAAKFSQKVEEDLYDDVTVPVLTAEEAAELPDIYYFIFDRYARADVLEVHYDYDNSGFIKYLESAGFYVAAESFANYPRTWLSLGSSLNLKYLNYLKDEVGETSTDKAPVLEMLQDYEVWRFLKKKGYTFIHFGDWWSGTAKNRYADENFNYLGLVGNEFVDKLLENTMAYPVFKKLFPTDYVARKRTLYKFAKLAEMPGVEGPKFIFVHMLTPHEPFVFDRDGNPITPQQSAQRSLRENYINQLIFTTRTQEAPPYAAALNRLCVWHQ